MDSRRAATIEVDARLVEAVRTLAAQTGRAESQILEAAVREYLGAHVDILGVLQPGQNELSEDEALGLAYAELHAMRRERDHR